MSEDPRNTQEGFLGRWSRRKSEAHDTVAAPAVPANDGPAARDPATDTPPALPPVESLTLDSDFRGFFHPKVDEDLRRAALRKLFSDPHFNVMDGLDVYIDDYTKTEPIPAAMMAGLRQAQRILAWAEGKDEDEDTAVSAAEGESPAGDGNAIESAASIEHEPLAKPEP